MTRDDSENGVIERKRDEGLSLWINGTASDDYNDYDEVTIPPNLTDLLAQLPDDLSADSLQRMFRDQVLSSKDRKNLLESFEYLKNEMKVRIGQRREIMGGLQKRNKPKTQRIHRELKAGDLRSGDRLSQIQVRDYRNTKASNIVEEHYNQ